MKMKNKSRLHFLLSSMLITVQEPISSKQHITQCSSVCSHCEEMWRLSIFGLCIHLFSIKKNSNRNKEAEHRQATHHGDKEENAVSSMLRQLKFCPFKTLQKLEAWKKKDLSLLLMIKSSIFCILLSVFLHYNCYYRCADCFGVLLFGRAYSV